ncbi:hypothetical protein CDAR_241631 [Caerostris darwini]|uniref:Uncharacterized protein n=1 Tax=Caerostris darwini TaxID=1538125 RepID=A0AAV4SIW7_9ARAC|nr:hypothetical protein CDAR_241631 [Caerostris darwini]
MLKVKKIKEGMWIEKEFKKRSETNVSMLTVETGMKKNVAKNSSLDPKRRGNSKETQQASQTELRAISTVECYNKFLARKFSIGFEGKENSSLDPKRKVNNKETQQASQTELIKAYSESGYNKSAARKFSTLLKVEGGWEKTQHLNRAERFHVYSNLYRQNLSNEVKEEGECWKTSPLDSHRKLMGFNPLNATSV